MRLHLVLGNHLFAPSHWPADLAPHTIFMREDRQLCTYFPFHKHKIILFLAAMRTYAEELRASGYSVIYDTFDPNSDQPFTDRLRQIIDEGQFTSLSYFEIEDHFFEQTIRDGRLGIDTIVLNNPMFLTSRHQFSDYLDGTKKPFLKTFYEYQRRRLNLLISPSGDPIGGQWSFDHENRKPMPRSVIPPALPEVPQSPIVQQIINDVLPHFDTHPGSAHNFWLPVDRAGALQWLDRFIDERLPLFGPYEDAMPNHSVFGYHSVLTPLLNVGLITPQDVLDRVTEIDVPLPSLEGFIRQVIGWREFIRGIYHHFDEVQHRRNFFNHHNRLSPRFWDGTTEIPLVDRVIRTVNEWGYCHHIERLMVLGTLMTVLEIHPHDAYHWFMSLFIDSSDWVMGPNVYGMALFSDGGIFATKPYICGSSYWRKMSGEPAGPWCDEIDGLYWQFIDKHRAFFEKNPRLSMMVRQFDRMSDSRKSTIFDAAHRARSRLTLPPVTRDH